MFHSSVDGFWSCFHFGAIMNKTTMNISVQAYLILLYFTLLPSWILKFLQIEGLWQPVLSKSIGVIFPTAFAHFVSLCHILVILPVFQNFSLLCLLW